MLAQPLRFYSLFSSQMITVLKMSAAVQRFGGNQIIQRGDAMGHTRPLDIDVFDGPTPMGARGWVRR